VNGIQEVASARQAIKIAYGLIQWITPGVCKTFEVKDPGAVSNETGAGGLE
jgi:hypothetical protein